MKKTVGILYGGKSAEHEISLLSAKNVFDTIDKEKFEPVMIKIEKNGHWESRDFSKIDVVFPVLHGPFGEDGTVQGLLKLEDIPFVGSGVLGSAVGMDKDVMKRLLRDAGIPIGKFLTVRAHEQVPSFEEVVSALGCTEGTSPIFIKPANMGSSVGISKVTFGVEFTAAVKEAFLYDTKIIMEEFIPGREIECAVLGNEEPIASVPGELITTDSFYSYDAKYNGISVIKTTDIPNTIDDIKMSSISDKSETILQIPAKLDEAVVKRIQDMAIKVYNTLCCEGLSRVDFFLKDSGELIVNEINTMPGFTKVSMYPKMFENSGISYTELITRLIELAIARHEKEKKLKTSFV